MTTSTDSAGPVPAEDEVSSRRRLRLVPVALAVAVLALLGGLVLGRGMEAAAAGTADVQDAVSLGFLRDMGTHHAQAVRMSEIVHRRSSDPALNYLAFDIMSTQQGQIGIMTGWLDLSREPQSATGPVMAWMGHSGPMPGMATDTEIEALDTLPVPQLEVQYLRLMIEHHRGALGMAQYAVDRAGSPDVARLAEGMLTGQAAEIALMERMLAERGAAVPDATTSGHTNAPGATPAPAASSHDGH